MVETGAAPSRESRATSHDEAWIAWVNRRDVRLPAIVQAGLAHYEFETLHPYSDGNGRIGGWPSSSS